MDLVIIVNIDDMRIVGGMNIKSISFDVDNIPVEVDFEENIITIDNTDYTKENIKNVLKCLKEISYDLQWRLFRYNEAST